MIAADLTVTTQRIEALDFTLPFLASDLTVLAKVVSIFSTRCRKIRARSLLFSCKNKHFQCQSDKKNLICGFFS